MTVDWNMTEVQSYEDHEVLESEYCSGYIDGNGKWNSGFYCSSANAAGPLHCCGTDSHKYCCLQKEAFSDHSIFDADLPFVFGIILGIATAMAIVMLASCCFCSCCLLYKKRHSNLHDDGPIYQMHCSSTASGVASSMYSFSAHNSISTRSSHSVFQQLAIPDTIHVNEAGEEIVGSVMDADHLEFQNNLLPSYTFNGDRCRKNWSQVQHEAEKDSGTDHHTIMSLSSKNLTCNHPEEPSAPPEPFGTTKDLSVNSVGEIPAIHSFYSCPEERKKTFLPKKEESSNNFGCRVGQIPESPMITLTKDGEFTESKSAVNNVVHETRGITRDENLYRSTKF